MSTSTSHITTFIASLEHPGSGPSIEHLTASWVNTGQFDALHDIAVVLATQTVDINLDGWVVDGALRHIERVLALTPAARSVATLFAFVGAVQRNRDVRALAAMLAQAQSPAVLIPLFERYAQVEAFDDLLLHIAQELVIRLISCADIPAIARHVEHMRAKRKPLALLPLMLMLELETELDQYLPVFLRAGGQQRLPPPGNVLAPLPNELIARYNAILAGRTAEEQTTRELQQTVGRGFADWSRVEVRSFAVAPLVEPAITPAFLLSLDLAALRDGTPEQFVINASSPVEAFTMLFYAAAHGGAYNKGVYAAEARLHAWETLRAMAHQSKISDFAALETYSTQCRWWNIAATTPWFSQDYDLFLVMLTPERDRFVVIAATSTD